MLIVSARRCALAAVLTWFSGTAYATIPYGVVTPGTPALGPGLASPKIVTGKEYSHDRDHEINAVGVAPDPQQIVAWDGSGGVANGQDFSGTRPNYRPDDQIDATANHGDFLFNALRDDRAHLVFSHDDMISVYAGGPPGGGGGPFTPGPFVPAGGPVTLSNGNMIGGAGELSHEVAGMFSPPSTQGLWAKQADINGMPLPRDIDGVEMWGPEPAFAADVDKYSMNVDSFSGGSVWNGSGAGYIPHASIVAAVTALLGPVPGGAVLPFPTFIDGVDAINVDALMVQDIIGDPDSFDRDPAGAAGDQIIFSIQQIPNSTDPDGYYATGSELFVMDASLGPAGTTFLKHGGHVWDHAYALSDLALAGPGVDGYGVIDINAIEAIGERVVPEPASALLMFAGLTGLGWLRRRQS